MGENPDCGSDLAGANPPAIKCPVALLEENQRLRTELKDADRRLRIEARAHLEKIHRLWEAEAEVGILWRALTQARHEYGAFSSLSDKTIAQMDAALTSTATQIPNEEPGV